MWNETIFRVTKMNYFQPFLYINDYILYYRYHHILRLP